VSRLSDLLHKALGPGKQIEQARERLKEDQAELKTQADKIEKHTSAMEKRVYKQNNISAAVTAMLRGHK